MSKNDCQICTSNPSKYNCPRCSILYCSLNCYKSPAHSQCSENFYKECIVEEIQSDQKDKNAAQKMVDILKKFENLENNLDEEDEEAEEIEEDSDDAEEIPDLAARLIDIDLNNADAIWNKLTEDEKLEFQNMVQNGDIEKVIPNQVEPFWTQKLERKLVEEVCSPENDLKERLIMENCPQIIRKIKDFNEITTKDPSPLVRNNMVNIIAAYSFMFRYFNGDHHCYVHEATNLMIKCSLTLSANSVFETEAMAIESVFHELMNNEYPVDKNTMKKDVSHILKGPNSSKKWKIFFILSSLSNLHNLFTMAKNSPKSSTKDVGDFSKKFRDHNDEDFQPIDQVKLKNSIKKVEYFLSYCKKFL